MTSLVIPVFNKVELTLRCLDSVLSHSTQLEEVFIIDNASTDTTPIRLLEFKARFESKAIPFKIITNQTNLGFGRACNQGIREARGETLALLNNDTWVMPNWDGVLSEVIQKEKFDLLGPFFDERPSAGDLQERSQTYLRQNSEKIRAHFVPILMFFKSSAIDKLKLPHGGIFDERFFVTYEDTDLIFRMRELQLQYGQTSLCYIWHHSMGTRASPGLLPQGYEADGLRLFIEKWGFDPRLKEHTWMERWKRKYRIYRASRGLF